MITDVTVILRSVHLRRVRTTTFRRLNLPPSSGGAGETGESTAVDPYKELVSVQFPLRTGADPFSETCVFLSPKQ